MGRYDDMNVKMSRQTTLPFDLSEFRPPSPIEKPQVIILGIFGSKRGLSEIYLRENIINPILEEIGRVPEKALTASDNTASSIYIEEWARSLNIPTQLFEADFRTRGRSAAIFRDSRIERECTVALVFQAPRTTRYDLLAERMARKGKRVFFIRNDMQIELLEGNTPPDGSAFPYTPSG